MVCGQKRLDRLHHLHSHSEGVYDTVESADAGDDHAVLHFRNVGLGGVDASGQFSLCNLCLFACVEQYLAKVEG